MKRVGAAGFWITVCSICDNLGAAGTCASTGFGWVKLTEIFQVQVACQVLTLCVFIEQVGHKYLIHEFAYILG